jgi:hypothetical protein
MQSVNDRVGAYSDASGRSEVATFNTKFYACQVFCVG